MCLTSRYPQALGSPYHSGPLKLGVKGEDVEALFRTVADRLPLFLPVLDLQCGQRAAPG